jgi:hypothetical protein
MMRPKSRARMAGNARWMIWKGAVRLTASERCQSASANCSTGGEVTDHGVVDHDVGSAERFVRELHQAIDRGAIGEIGLTIGHSDSVARCQGRALRFHRLWLIEPMQNNVESAGCETLRRGVAETAARTGHQGGSTGRVHQARLSRSATSSRAAMPSSSADGGG